MIQIDNKIISLDIFENHFACDLNSCKGACCVEGDSGAPLLLAEKNILEEIYKKIKPYMRQEGIDVVEKEGPTVIDIEGDLTTTLVKNKECSFVVFENGIAKCSIEQAYNDNIIDFKKPISCHLFPIRITEYSNFDAINYEKIKICEPACECGSNLKLPLFVFLKQAIIRKYGGDFYKELLLVSKHLKRELDN
tara:strand:- start:327232 stop:327810 length:579 start_codon:yes stop_codon:yes gene_type:complete